MAGDYKEELKKLLGKLGRGSLAGTPPTRNKDQLPTKESNIAPAVTPPRAQTVRSTQSKNAPRAATTPAPSGAAANARGKSSSVGRPNLEITLGVDFGTRFTKVAAFLRQTGEYKVLPIGPEGSPFMRSWTVTDATEQVYPPDLRPPLAKGSIEYLKMHLVNPASIAFGGNKRLGGYSLQGVIEPLCALYLSGVLRRAATKALRAFSIDADSQRDIDWFANVGVPVQYCDGKELARFQRVAAVAWRWKEDLPASFGIKELVDLYERTAGRCLDFADLPIQVVPELAAALAHFVERRTTAEGMYAFFDVGGGTLDGAAFHLTLSKQKKIINILAAAVDDVGTMAVAREAVANFYVDMNVLVEKPLIFGPAAPQLDLPISKAGYRIQQLFNRVVREAKMKRPALDFSDLDRPKLKSIAGPKAYPRYPVFMAGGGARSQWYADLFRRTHSDFSQHQAGIGECDIKLIPTPDGFSGDDYPRFVVAIGLTADSVQFDSYRLPSHTAPPPAMEQYRPSSDSPITKDYV